MLLCEKTLYALNEKKLCLFILKFICRYTKNTHVTECSKNVQNMYIEYRRVTVNVCTCNVYKPHIYIYIDTACSY